MMTKTRATKASEVTREWHLLDAKGEILGRFASRAAQLLIGKHKPNWAPYLDMGDHVVVTNAREIAVTGKKEKQKVYHRHSGYPGGLKSETLEELRERRPEEIIRRAVKGMLPTSKLGRRMITRLHVYPGEEGEMVAKAKENQNG